MFWLCYHRDGALFAVVIIEAAELMMARLRASLAGLGLGGVFAEGHALDAACRAVIAREDIGRMLSPSEAAELVERFANAHRRKPPVPSRRRPARVRKAS